MRHRNLLLAALAALLAIASVLWFAAADENPESHERAVEAPSASAHVAERRSETALDTERESVGEPATPDTARARVAYAPDGIFARGAIVVGALSTRDGAVVDASSVHLDFRVGELLAFATDNTSAGNYRAGPLAPGEYKVKLTSSRFDAQEFALVVPDDATTIVRDIVLTEPLILLVHARTPDGELLARALMSRPEFDYSFFLEAAATRTQVPLYTNVLAPADGDALSIGEFKRDLRASDGSDLIGNLRVPALPVFVHMTWAGTIVASAAVPERAHEVHFVIDVGRLTRLTGSLRVRVIDADSAAPIDDAHVTIRQKHPVRTSHGRTDVSGVALLAGLSPESVEISIESDGHGPWKQSLATAPGALLDVGTVQLARLVTLAVRVVDHGGRPVRMPLELFVLEDGPSDHSTSRREAVGPDVTRLTGLAQRRYVVRSSTPATKTSKSAEREVWSDSDSIDWSSEEDAGLRVPPVIVDLAAQGDRELVLTALAAPACSFELEFERPMAVQIQVTTESGLPVFETSTRGFSTVNTALAPGAYVVRARYGAAQLAERTFEIASESVVVQLR